MPTKTEVHRCSASD